MEEYIEFNDLDSELAKQSRWLMPAEDGLYQNFLMPAFTDEHGKIISESYIWKFSIIYNRQGKPIGVYHERIA